jgi:hypothetical protein
LLATVILAAFAGCSENKPATEQCKEAYDNCANCCSQNGAKGHSMSNIGANKYCKCLN